jgi:hypothetical protein
MTALSDNRDTKKLASENYAQKAFAVLNGEILYAGGMLAMNTSTMEVQMASDSAGLVVLGRCPKYVDNTFDGEVSNVDFGVFQYANSTTYPLTKTYIGKVCYAEDDNIVGHSPGTNAVKAGIVYDVDDEGVWVIQKPQSILATS